MSTGLAPLSASVTRILSLTGFPKELKTRDIQAAFSDCENLNGGFKIKWINDTSLLIVFVDAAIAKRAYLQTLASPPAVFSSPTSDTALTIKPYDGPDAQTVIQNVNTRHASNPSRSHNTRASVSVPSIHTRSGSGRNGNGNGNGALHEHLNEVNVSIPPTNIGREPSPTLPSLPSQPTLNSLISSSLSDVSSTSSVPSDPAIIASSSYPEGMTTAGGPRIGDPGKRMLGAALGVRHPGLGASSRQASGGPGSPGTSPSNHFGGADQAMREIQKAMGGLVVAE